MAGEAGFEPTYAGIKTRCLYHLATPQVVYLQGLSDEFRNLQRVQLQGNAAPTAHLNERKSIRIRALQSQLRRWVRETAFQSGLEGAVLNGFEFFEGGAGTPFNAFAGGEDFLAFARTKFDA